MATYNFNSMQEFAEAQDRFSSEAINAASLDSSTIPVVLTIPDAFISEIDAVLDDIANGVPPVQTDLSAVVAAVTVAQNLASTTADDLALIDQRLTVVEGVSAPDLSGILASISIAETDISTLETRVDSVEITASNAAGAGQQANSRLDTLEPEVASNDTRIGALETDLSSLEARVSTNEADIAAILATYQYQKSTFSQFIARRVRKMDADIALGKPVVQVPELDIDDLADVLFFFELELPFLNFDLHFRQA